MRWSVLEQTSIGTHELAGPDEQWTGYSFWPGASAPLDRYLNPGSGPCFAAGLLAPSSSVRRARSALALGLCCRC